MASRHSDSENSSARSSDDLDAKLDRVVPPEAPAAFLVAGSGADAGRVYPLDRNTMRVGRGEGVEIRVHDSSVSAEHARILNGSVGFQVEDLSSTNGTFVNDQRVTNANIKGGDRLRFGAVEFRFMHDQKAEATIALEVALMPLPVPRVTYTAREQSWQPTSEPPEEGPNLIDMVRKGVLIYRFLRGRARLIGVFVAFGVGVGIVSATVLPAPSAAFCEMRLQPRIKINPVDQGGFRSAEEDLKFFVAPERAFTHSGLVLDTLTSLGFPNEDLAEEVSNRLKIELIGDAMYRATYQEKIFSAGKLPLVPLLDAHVKHYVKSETEKALRGFIAEADFLRGQVKEQETELASLSSQIMKFRESNVDRLPEQSAQTHASRFQMETRRVDLVAQVRRLEGELENDQVQLRAESPIAQSNFQASQVYRDGLAAAKRKLAEAFARGLASAHPEVRQLTEEKARIEKLIEEQMRGQTTQLDRNANAGFTALQSRVAVLQSQLRAARTELGDIDGKLRDLRKIVGDLPRVDAGLQDLVHRQDATKRLHDQLFDKLKKAELQLNLERVSAESRFEMTVSPTLQRMGRMKTLALRGGLGVVAGLFLAALFIGLAEIRRIVAKVTAMGPSQGL